MEALSNGHEVILSQSKMVPLLDFNMRAKFMDVVYSNDEFDRVSIMTRNTKEGDCFAECRNLRWSFSLISILGQSS